MARLMHDIPQILRDVFLLFDDAYRNLPVGSEVFQGNDADQPGQAGKQNNGDPFKNGGHG
jgi:hypothetical protein